nr:hypothetical protein [Micromonospora sp. DSM 115978]
MNIELVLLITLAATWLTAGLVADGLPGIRTAGALRRRTGSLLVLTVGGLLAMASIGFAALVTAGPTLPDRISLHLSLPAVPALVVAVSAVPRLRRIWSAAGAFRAAPDTPVPPALRAGVAHPLIGFPLQVAGLVTLPATVTAAGLVPLTGPAMIGMVLTGAVFVAVTIGVRHALRHSRLTERAVLVRPPASPRPDGLLHV